VLFKWILCFWVLCSLFLFLGNLSFGGEERFANEARDLRKKQLALDHSFAKLQVRIAEENLGADEARDLMGQWREQNKEARQEIKNLRLRMSGEREKNRPEPQMPVGVPSRVVGAEEEFLEEVQSYFRKASEVIWHRVDTKDPEAFEAARDNFSRFMESKESRFLIEETKEARKVIMSALMRRPPMTREEIQLLDLEEQLEEEIYVEVYREMFDPALHPEPIDDGEEWRDKMARLRPMIDQKREEFWKAHPNLHLEKLRARKATLNTQLHDARNETERIK